MNGFLGVIHNDHRTAVSAQRTSLPKEVSAGSEDDKYVVNKEVAPNGIDGSEDLGQPSGVANRIVRKSRIVYCLTDVLRDSSALAYFIHYLEAIGQPNLLKFWLHVESFKASLVTMTIQDGSLLKVAKNDATNIFSRYICKDAPYPIGITNGLRQNVIDGICEKDGSVSLHCFDGAQEFVREILENRYFEGFLSSTYYAKHRLDVISSGDLSVRDIMFSQDLLSSFVEFLEGEGERRLIEFLIAADTFKRQLPQVEDDDTALEDAMIIYERFFSMQAKEPLKLGAKVRIQIESDICTQSGRPLPTCFDSAYRIITSSIEQNYLRPFLASPPFTKYIRELMKQVDYCVELPDVTRKVKTLGSGSDHSSELSLPTSLFDHTSRGQSLNHLYLSGSTSQLYTRSDDMDETVSLTDSVKSCGARVPSRLRRSRAHSSLATVDHLGRYRPMYDNSQVLNEDGSTASKIKSTLHKYLHQSVLQEAEVADHIAQLIIADVHNMISTSNCSTDPLLNS